MHRLVRFRHAPVPWPQYLAHLSASLCISVDSLLQDNTNRDGIPVRSAVEKATRGGGVISKALRPSMHAAPCVN